MKSDKVASIQCRLYFIYTKNRGGYILENNRCIEYKKIKTTINTEDDEQRWQWWRWQLINKSNACSMYIEKKKRLNNRLMVDFDRGN